MKLLVIFDGSDDGFEGLRLAAEVLAGKGRHESTLAVIGWPPRVSPLWDKAFTAQVTLDDLHRSMAEVASRELKRLQTLFAPLGPSKSHFGEGDPVDEIERLIASEKPELVLVGLTRGRHREVVLANVGQVIARTQVPMFVTYGPEPKK